MGVNKDHPKENIQKPCRAHHSKISSIACFWQRQKDSHGTGKALKWKKKKRWGGRFLVSLIGDYLHREEAGRLVELVWVAHFAFSDGY